MARWALVWLESLDVAPTTMAQYRSLITRHIVPRYGSLRLEEISGLDARMWALGLRDRYADATVATIMKLLSMVLADAVRERLIPANPIYPARRGRRPFRVRPRTVWADPEQVLRVGLRACELVGGWAGVLIVTAGWTGARWGELLGLQRHNLHLDLDRGQGWMVIDPERGALHEVNGQFSLGRPKTAHSARTVELPAFLVGLLVRHLNSHEYRHVFVTNRGEYPRRSNFARRALRPAADGTLDRVRTRWRWAPVATGLTFHGLRHSHATWLVADHIPAPARAGRLGHALPNPVDQVYSHVAPELRAHLLDCLTRRWDNALGAVGGHVVGEKGHRGRPDAVAAARRRAKARRATLRPTPDRPTPDRPSPENVAAVPLLLDGATRERAASPNGAQHGRTGLN
jgi:integrase